MINTNSNRVLFSVDGEPVPKQSFRIARQDGRVHGFAAPRVREWQTAVAWQARVAMQDRNMFCTAVMVDLHFRLGNKRRVDLDNLSKAILDALNGVAWKDDSCVMDLHLRKTASSDNPGVSIEIRAA